MTVTENIFLAWAFFCGGVTLLVATLILLFNATKQAACSDCLAASPAARAGAVPAAVTKSART